MTEADRTSVQRALDGWARIAPDVLELDPGPLPWTVVHDDRCAWHLAPDPSLIDAPRAAAELSFLGEPVDVRAVAHHGILLLPRRTAEYVTSGADTRRYGETAAVVRIAVPDLWQLYGSMFPHEMRVRVEAVFLHEWVHARQVARLDREYAQVRSRLPHIPDSEFHSGIVIDRFGKLPGFRDAVRKERRLLLGALSRAPPSRHRELAIRILDLIDRRRAQYYTGENAPFVHVEDLYLNAEGIAEFAAYQFLRRTEGDSDAGFMIAFKRNMSQAHGFLLCLLLDQLSPGWHRQWMSSELPSPVELLRAAVARAVVDRPTAGS